MSVSIRLNEPTKIKDAAATSYLNELVRTLRNGFSSAVNEREQFYISMCTPATAINPPGAPSDPDVDTASGLFLFDGTSTELIFYSALLPPTYVAGSDIHLGIRWQKTTSVSGNVAWEFGWKKAKLGSVMDTSFTTAIASTPHEDTPDNNLADESLVTISGTSVDGSDLSPGDSLVLRISRVGGDVLDTYNDDARCVGCGFIYLSNRETPSVFGFS